MGTYRFVSNDIDRILIDGRIIFYWVERPDTIRDLMNRIDRVRFWTLMDRLRIERWISQRCFKRRSDFKRLLI